MHGLFLLANFSRMTYINFYYYNLRKGMEHG